MRPSHLLLACLLCSLPRPVVAQSVPPESDEESQTRPDSRFRLGATTVSGSLWLHSTVVRAREDESDRLAVSRARLGASGGLGGRLRYNVSADLTEPSFRGASLTLRVHDAVSVRAGRFNPLATLERGTSPTDLELMGRSSTSGALTSPPTLAVSVFGEGASRRWLGYAINFTRGRGFDWTDPDRSHDASGRLSLAPPRVGGLTLVLSAARGRQQGGQRTLTGLGVDYRTGPWHLMAEGLHEQRASGARSGVMAMAAYRVLRDPSRDLARLEVAARLATVGDAPSADGLRNWQAGLNYYFTPDVRLMGHVNVPTDGHDSEGPTFAVRWQAGF